MVGVQIPHHFRCPISLELMLDPMTVSTGQTYDRSNIEPWIAAGNTTCPVTRAPLLDFTLIPNHTLRRLIQSWCVANCHSGVERIPTPKQPADPSRVHALLSQATSTSSAAAVAAGLIIFLKQDDRQGSGGHCGQLAGRRYAVLLRNPKAETPKGSEPWTGGGGRLHADASRRRTVPRPEAAMSRLELELWQTQEKRKEKWRKKRGRKSRRQKRRGGERVKGRDMELMEREWDAARWAQICHVSTFEWWYISPTRRVKPTQYFLP